MAVQTNKTQEPTGIVREWWASMQNNRGARAELRRATSLTEVVLLPFHFELRARLAGTAWRHIEGVALIAGALAHVDHDDPGLSFPAQMARPRGSGQGAIVSDLRFRRLIQHKTRTDLFVPIIRIVRLLGRTANVSNLAESLYWWNDCTRRECAFAYYEQAVKQK